MTDAVVSFVGLFIAVVRESCHAYKESVGLREEGNCPTAVTLLSRFSTLRPVSSTLATRNNRRTEQYTAIQNSAMHADWP